MPNRLFNLPSDPLVDTMSYLTLRDVFRTEITHPRFFQLLSSSYMDGKSTYPGAFLFESCKSFEGLTLESIYIKICVK